MQNSLETKFNVSVVKSRSLDKRQASGLSKAFSFIGTNLAQVLYSKTLVTKQRYIEVNGGWARVFWVIKKTRKLIDKHFLGIYMFKTPPTNQVT